MRRKRLPKGQTKLFPDEPTIVVKIEEAQPKKYFCPFCLYEGYLHEFQIMNKKGASKKRAKCPDCGQKMRMQTLTQKMTPVQLAQFIFNYQHFWGQHRLSWQKIKSRLKILGISNTFWEAWKQIKQEYYRQKYGITYEEYLASLQS